MTASVKKFPHNFFLLPNGEKFPKGTLWRACGLLPAGGGDQRLVEYVETCSGLAFSLVLVV
jgi:hypothetical protein